MKQVGMIFVNADEDTFLSSSARQESFHDLLCQWPPCPCLIYLVCCIYCKHGAKSSVPVSRLLSFYLPRGNGQVSNTMIDKHRLRICQLTCTVHVTSAEHVFEGTHKQTFVKSSYTVEVGDGGIRSRVDVKLENRVC